MFSLAKQLEINFSINRPDQSIPSGLNTAEQTKSNVGSSRVPFNPEIENKSHSFMDNLTLED